MVSGHPDYARQQIPSPTDGARFYRTSNQTIPNAVETGIIFNAYRWLKGGISIGGPGSSKIYVGRAGMYIITVNAAFNTNATGTRYLTIRVSGGTYVAMDQKTAAPANWTWLLATTPYRLYVPDYVEAMVFQDSGGNLDVLAAPHESPELTLQWLSSL